MTVLCAAIGFGSCYTTTRRVDKAISILYHSQHIVHRLELKKAVQYNDCIPSILIWEHAKAVMVNISPFRPGIDDLADGVHHCLPVQGGNMFQIGGFDRVRLAAVFVQAGDPAFCG